MRIITLPDRDPEEIESRLTELSKSDVLLDSFQGGRLLELVRRLQSQTSTSTVWGRLRPPELWLSPYRPNSKGLIKVRVDWYDYGPIEDGYPKTHFRIEISGVISRTKSEVRVGSVNEAEGVICKAFGFSE